MPLRVYSCSRLAGLPQSKHLVRVVRVATRVKPPGRLRLLNNRLHDGHHEHEISSAIEIPGVPVNETARWQLLAAHLEAFHGALGPVEPDCSTETVFGGFRL